MFESMLNVQHAVLRFAADFDAAVLSGTQAETVVKVAARMKNALAAVESLAAARVAACGTWRDTGAVSAADWLAQQTGTTTSGAKDRLDMGEALSGGLDATASRARNGELSVEKTIAI